MERQAAGYKIEAYALKDKDYEAHLEGTYTSPYDAWSTKYHCPIQIKGKKTSNLDKTRIELGSVYRLPKEEDFLLTLFPYKKTKDGTLVYEKREYLIDKDLWNAGIPDGLLQAVSHERVFGGISNDRKDDAIWKERRKAIKKEVKDMNGLFTPLFKRDHRNQKRVQVNIAVSNLDDLSKGITITKLNCLL